MIKEKDVEKCKFFTTTGGDIWRTKKVKLITEVELVNCETGRTETCRVNEQSAERFVAIAIPRIIRAGGRGQGSGNRGQGSGARGQGSGVKGRKTGGRKREPLKKAAAKHDRRGCRKGKPPSSQYLGVTVHQAKSGPRYYAQVSRGGKFKGLGIHNVEELAAAAVQEHLGNHAEAKRLTEIARQKTRFLCSGCGADYEQQPEKCGKCGGGSFEKI